MNCEHESTVLTLASITKAINTPRARVNISDNIIQEELRISGDALIHKIEELMHQGHSIRRIKIQNREGYTLLSIPITREKLSLSSFDVPEVTSAHVIGAMVEQPKIIVEWQISCPISCPLRR